MKLEPLPDGLLLVSLGEMTSFGVYGSSGGLVNRRVSYLVRKGDGELPDIFKRGLDLGLPDYKEEFRIFDHERGWKHAAVWVAETDDLKSAREALLNA